MGTHKLPLRKMFGFPASTGTGRNGSSIVELERVLSVGVWIAGKIGVPRKGVCSMMSVITHGKILRWNWTRFWERQQH